MEFKIIEEYRGYTLEVIEVTSGDHLCTATCNTTGGFIALLYHRSANKGFDCLVNMVDLQDQGEMYD